jgi:hypothetical protein
MGSLAGQGHTAASWVVVSTCYYVSLAAGDSSPGGVTDRFVVLPWGMTLLGAKYILEGLCFFIFFLKKKERGRAAAHAAVVQLCPRERTGDTSRTRQHVIQAARSS